MWLLLAGLGLAHAADLEHKLTWDVTVGGTKVGTRNLRVKYVKEEGQVGMRRVLESWTELDGTLGTMRATFRQRMTAHASGSEPASFHAVSDQNGAPQEVQARWTPGAWWVTTTAAGRSRTVDMPSNRIDLSTADLMDPDSRYPLGHFSQLRLLSAETGEVITGAITPLGTKTMTLGRDELPVNGFAWDSPQGRSEFWYAQDGFLVHYTMPVLGITMVATLQKAPPGGVDDFPVAVAAPAVEQMAL